MAQQLLVEQNEALVDFLDDLLTEPAQEMAHAGGAAPVQAMPVDTPEPLVEHVNEENRLVPEESPATESPVDVEYIPENDLSPQAVTGRVPVIPDWGTQAFQAMIFKVGDLSLAIPLMELAGVVEWRPEPGAKTEATGFHLGSYSHAGQSVTVIDTARFIFPAERLEALYGPGTNPQISRLILIDGGNIGLACDEVDEIVSIQPDQVNWRTEKTRRKWLAGTMLAQLVVVLDARRLAALVAAEPNGLNKGG